MAGLHVIALLGYHQHSRIDNAQTLLIAEKLAKGGKLYQKSIYWNILINLPRFVLFFVPVWLLVKHNDGFTDIEQCDVIVTCGRKMVRYARHLKKYCCPDAKIVQIGNPYCDLKGVDVLLRPKHGRNLVPFKNVIRYRGYLCDPVNKEVAQEVEDKFLNIKNALQAPYISVFVGGNTARYKMTPEIAEKFCKQINDISHNMNMPLLICVDERVYDKTVEAMKKQLDCSYYFYCKKYNVESPKVAFMEWGSFYILIGNSIVDQSELILQGKPTYVYYAGSHGGKYKKFYNGIIEDCCARSLTETDDALAEFKPVPLNDMNAIIDNILKLSGLNETVL